MSMAGTRNALQQLRELGQSAWLDYIRRGLIESGELRQLVDLGIGGLTANPTILEKAIVGSTDYDGALATLAGQGKKPLEIYEALAIEDIRGAADLLRPVHDRTRGADGFACLEVSPLVAYDTEKTVEEAKELFRALERPNVMVKVPATAPGIEAIRMLTAAGVNVNVTLIFSQDFYAQVKEAYLAGLEELVRKGGNPAGVASVASFFLSRIDTLVDGLIEERLEAGQPHVRELLGKTAIASAKTAYAEFKKTFSGPRFQALREKGARPQRLLWASTGAKNPAYSDVMYVEPLIGAGTVNTMPLATIHAFLDHGCVAPTIEQGLDEARQTFESLKAAGASMKDVTDRLLADGVKSFSDSFEKLMAGIAAKAAGLAERRGSAATSNLGKHEETVRATLDRLGSEETVRRIWRKDHTVWSDSPKEITDRLGWLYVTDLMREHVAELEKFAREVRDQGVRQVVLIGMGGSSLAAEVLRQTLGSRPGYPGLIVLDSTLPAAVLATTQQIDPARTLFLVSSKSGATTEPLLLYRYFRNLVEKAVGENAAGQHLAAITDPATPLEAMARRVGFRRVFLNPPDIGGRYSALSCFGLVPAALIGADIGQLMDRADAMREGCASCLPQVQNHGAWLGAYLGGLAVNGRDKLTLLTSPSIGVFGLWVEQLVAESTGKHGQGIVPVTGEPLLPPGSYRDDRAFVYLRLKGDENTAVDAAVTRLREAGHPVAVLEMRDKYDLGAEFFRWEFATAVAGAILGVHPFDQPDVQRAKDATEDLLREFRSTGRLTPPGNHGDLAGLLAGAVPGDYFAVMAYLSRTPELDGVLADFRGKVAQRYRMPTMVCYGPRYLHSSGQLHKARPGVGLFLLITAEHRPDVPIPGDKATFGVVADAQALGDLEALRAVGARVASIRLENQAPQELVRVLMT